MICVGSDGKLTYTGSDGIISNSYGIAMQKTNFINLSD